MKYSNRISKDDLQQASVNSATAKNSPAFTLQDNRPSSALQQKQLASLSQKPVSAASIQLQENKSGLPASLKTNIENLSGHSMDDVKVHYNSSQPAQLNAHAYAQGTDIHLAAGQEKHLPHEAWHVVQQKQGRVKPTMQMKKKDNEGAAMAVDPVQRKVNVFQNELADPEITIAKDILAKDFNTEVSVLEDNEGNLETKNEILLGHGAGDFVGSYTAEGMAEILKKKTEAGKSYDLAIFSCKMGEVKADGSSFPQKLHDLMAAEKVELNIIAPKKSIFVFTNEAYGHSEANLWADAEFKSLVYSELRLQAVKNIVNNVQVPAAGQAYDLVHAAYMDKDNAHTADLKASFKSVGIKLDSKKKNQLLAHMIEKVRNADMPENANTQKWFKAYEILVQRFTAFFNHHGNVAAEMQAIDLEYTKRGFQQYYERIQARQDNNVKVHKGLDYEKMNPEEKKLWTASVKKV